MTDILDQICRQKRQHIEARKRLLPLDQIKPLAENAPPTRGFIRALQKPATGGPHIIAEIKKASPSRGVIRDDFDPEAIAKAYAGAGASCLSVLTDEPYFQGHDGYIPLVKAACTLPVLRKDFMLDPYQIYESRVLGADCILLIMAALNDIEAYGLYKLARALGMDVLIEVHDEAEMERALAFKPEMIGVNNRNLKTLEVSIETSKTLMPRYPAGVLAVAESGLSDAQTLRELQNLGYRAFLIGESLMRENDIAAALGRMRQL